MKNFNMNASIILNKKFSTELSGYNAKEVDEFLDKILEDYQMFQNEIEILEKRITEKAYLISDKEEEIKKLLVENQNLKTQLKDSQKASQYEILQAINDLKKKDI